MSEAERVAVCSPSVEKSGADANSNVTGVMSAQESTNSDGSGSIPFITEICLAVTSGGVVSLTTTFSFHGRKPKNLTGT